MTPQIKTADSASKPAPQKRKKSLYKDIKPGTRYGQWVVIRFDGIAKSGHAAFVVKCDCGRVRRMSGSHLRTGKSMKCQTCSALRRESLRREQRIFGDGPVDVVPATRLRHTPRFKQLAILAMTSSDIPGAVSLLLEVPRNVLEAWVEEGSQQEVA